MSKKEMKENSPVQGKETGPDEKEESDQFKKMRAFFTKSLKSEEKFRKLVDSDDYEEAQELNEKWLKEWNTPRVRAFFKTNPEMMCQVFLMRLLTRKQIWLEHDDEFDAQDVLQYGLEFLSRLLEKTDEPAIALTCAEIAYDNALLWMYKSSTVPAEDDCELSTAYIWNLMVEPKLTLAQARLAKKRLDDISSLLELIKEENPEIQMQENYPEALQDLKERVDQYISELEKKSQK